MKKCFVRSILSIFLSVGFCAYGGELSYFPIPASQSDASSGIDSGTQYTSAIDAGSEANRVLNGATLYGSPGSGQTIVANNCAVTAQSGSLMTTVGAPENIKADGTLREVLSDVIYNSDAADNSQQEIVLDPKSLAAGTTYDLRVYVCNGGNGDRQINLAFVGDGQAPSETGFFNEDDARTSAGGFQDPNQVYCINYRFVWDGNSTPGVTVTQKSGQSPFVLYALTNQPVAAAAAASAPPPPPAAEGNQGVTAGMVTAESDQVGVTSDTFYSNESLNKNGRWINVKKYGRCWQPSNCPQDWRPYWRGNFRHCDDCGWTWTCDASEEEWGWAVYHYGRWCRVEGIGCGWAWVPGTEWSGAWVSWRSGKTPDCTCVGWAPLPPEATCRVGIGVSTWVDRECDIGPDYYTFVEVRHFGSSNYHTCGCLLERRRYVNIIEHTVNITNITYVNVNVNVNVHVNIYNGGPDLNWCNQEIRRHGQTEIAAIHINRFDDPGHFKGGKFSHVDGNMLAVFTPKVTREKNPKFVPKTEITVADNKIDHGWNNIKDKKIKDELKTKIADQTKGETPTTKKAVLPSDVADKLAKASPAPTAAPIASQSPSVSPAAGKSPSASPTVTTSPKIPFGKLSTASPGQSPSASPTATASPKTPFGKLSTASPSPSGSPTATTSPKTPFGKLSTASPSPSGSPTATTSPKPPFGKLSTASPTATASPRAPFGKLSTTSPLPSVSPTATASPKTPFGKLPMTSPLPSVSPTATASPKTPFGKLPMRSPLPSASPTATASPKSFAKPTGILATPTPTASPKVIRSVATATPISTPKSTSTPKPLIMSTPKPTPMLTPRPTPISTPRPTPKPTPMLTPRPTPISTPRPTPRPTPMSIPRPTPSGPSREQLLLQQQRQQQMQQQMQQQQSQQRRITKPTPTPTPTPIH